MPWLIDGNNLLFAVADVGPRDSVARDVLCGLIANWAAREGETAVVVFDGPEPPAGVRAQIEHGGLTVVFSGGRTADEVIIEQMEHSHAGRHLRVVSSDGQIARVARRRHTSVSSEDFARMVLRAKAPGETASDEPPAKQRGLTPEESARWRREFGISDAPDDDRR